MNETHMLEADAGADAAHHWTCVWIYAPPLVARAAVIAVAHRRHPPEIEKQLRSFFGVKQL